MKINYEDIRNKITCLNALADNVFNFTYSYYSVKYIIMCEGNVVSNCICVAEAPGATEEQYQRILVGSSGSLVRSILKKYGIERKVMFLNAIPWRPEGNATPTTLDIKNYIPFWIELFKILDIEHVLCFGRVAYKFITMLQNDVKNICVYKTWHPAFYLRNHKLEHLENIDNNILYLRDKINCSYNNCYFYFTRKLL